MARSTMMKVPTWVEYESGRSVKFVPHAYVPAHIPGYTHDVLVDGLVTKEHVKVDMLKEGVRPSAKLARWYLKQNPA